MDGSRHIQAHNRSLCKPLITITKTNEDRARIAIHHVHIPEMNGESDRLKQSESRQPKNSVSAGDQASSADTADP